jgi:hypothetical protein
MFFFYIYRWAAKLELKNKPAKLINTI